MGIACNLLVLLGDAFLCVDDHQHHIGTVNGPEGTHHAVTLNSFVNLALTAHACGINQHELDIVRHEMGINGITGSPRHIADNHPVLPNQGIDDRGLAHIRAADNSDADLVLLLVLPVILRKGSHYCIQKVTQPQ